MSSSGRGGAGRLVTLEHQSRVLADNPLGDQALRRFPVWLPAEYDSTRPGRRFPVLFDLVGYTGSGWSHVNWRAFDDSIPERAARLIAQRKMGPVIIVFPDCFTALGGNQYINAGAIGRYADYLVKELIPFIDKEFRTLAHREHRACFGKSSGGYGALVHAMKYPQYWGAAACHSGDAHFETVYLGDWPAALTELTRYRKPLQRPGTYRRPAALDGLPAGHDDGRVKRFLAHMRNTPNPSRDEVMALMMLAMAASYDSSSAAPNGFRLPVDLETGELQAPRWRQWLKHDPVRMVGRYQKALRSSLGLYIDCGWRDEHGIQYGSRLLSRHLHKFGITHRYLEFDGGHYGIDHRVDQSLPFLYKAIKP